MNPFIQKAHVKLPGDKQSITIFIFKRVIQMKYQTKLSHEIKEPMALIQPDITKEFSLPRDLKSGFVLMPIQQFQEGFSNTTEVELIGQQDRQLMAILVADVAGCHHLPEPASCVSLYTNLPEPA